MTAVIAVAVIFVVFGVLALIVGAVERLPLYPPTEEDVLPDPEWRARVPRVDPEREWIIE